MSFKMVVVRPFGGYKAGAVVSDPKAMLEIQQGEHADRVVRTAASPTPAIGMPVPAMPANSVKEG